MWYFPNMRNRLAILCLSLLLLLTACDNTDIRLASEAGLDAVTAVTLSDQALLELARQSAAYADGEHILAPADSDYSTRLRRLAGDHLQEDGVSFNFGVYLADEVNAFAMADGTIRLYSGLMDMLNDGELRFILGHEMGHVVKEHLRRKIQLAYAASALRKGLASQNTTLGDLARSQLGGFVELLMNAQFSQLEEKVADDYGLSFLRQKQYAPGDAVTALRKLATLGSGHTFLSTHPEPEKRAERLELQLQGKAVPVEEAGQNLLDRVRTGLKNLFADLVTWLQSLRDRLNRSE
ncbi:MAG TPA: peptidase M48 [Desulfobulbaceae bacterium]|nr:peptidase M48 [Desulfobulbaceae bacterium]